MACDCEDFNIEIPQGNDGEQGVNGNYLSVTAEAAGSNCPDGGVKITLYSGEDDSVLQEEYVCNASSPDPFGYYHTSGSSLTLTYGDSVLTSQTVTEAGVYAITVSGHVSTTNTAVTTIPITDVDTGVEGADIFSRSSGATWELGLSLNGNMIPNTARESNGFTYVSNNVTSVHLQMVIALAANDVIGILGSRGSTLTCNLTNYSFLINRLS